MPRVGSGLNQAVKGHLLVTSNQKLTGLAGVNTSSVSMNAMFSRHFYILMNGVDDSAQEDEEESHGWQAGCGGVRLAGLSACWWARVAAEITRRRAVHKAGWVQ